MTDSEFTANSSVYSWQTFIEVQAMRAKMEIREMAEHARRQIGQLTRKRVSKPKVK